jgi:hypothetical protein
MFQSTFNRCLASWLAVALLALFNISCATISRGSYQEISISSEPSGASVTIYNQLYGVTPTAVQLPRSKPHSVFLHLEGYEPVIIQIKSKPDGAVAGNCFCCCLGVVPGVVGFAVDALTGSGNTLAPEAIHVVLIPFDGTLPPAVGQKW